VRETRGTVWVKPQVVAEVAFNNVQTSPQYKSGVALRFARVLRLRDDKTIDEIDTVQTLRKYM
jgi:DNA ligase-1